jgi:hypothetical protein
MTSVMANDEQATNGETHGYATQQLGPQGLEIHRACQKCAPNRKIQEQ